MEAKGSEFLKVTGILMIIGGAFSSLVGLIIPALYIFGALKNQRA